MKFSESWLRQFVNPALSGAALSHRLTMAGLEVEEESLVAPAFSLVVVAAVLTVEKHPDADKLKLCRVDVGQGEIRQIVCGAPNVSVGIKVPCALAGAELPGGMTIKIAKVRGIESCGMLCSARELGISDEASGLLILPNEAPIGENIRHYLDLDDCLRTLKLTPNRADCLSLRGIAREVAAITDAPLKPFVITPVPVQTTHERAIVLDAPDACPRYCGRVISGVDATAPSPQWMTERLQRSGIRPISALVDITNYVMLELGQPLHAFDNTKLKGAIHVRLAQANEKILLLNEQTLSLSDDVLVIADERAPVAMAGIMGGEETGISLATNELFLESAFFASTAIAGRARRYGFVSDASHRFERGVDFAATSEALERASQLVIDICGGIAGPIVEAQATLPARNPVTLRSARVAKVLGVSFSASEISAFFTRLNLPFTTDGENFQVSPPSYRFDLAIEEDLIEEIARLYGYDNIPSPAPIAHAAMLAQTENERPLSKIRQTLADRGFQEVINFAFVDEAWERDFAANNALIKLANPIASTMSVMRSTLISGLIANVQTNLKRKQERVRIFEIGRCFTRNAAGQPIAGFDQPWKIAALSYGSALPEQWSNAVRPVDFYDIKGEVEQLFAPATLRFIKAKHPALHPGRSAEIYLGDKAIGIIGELHPQWQQKYALPQAPVVFELDLNAVCTAHWPHYQEFSSQPLVIRDLAVQIDQNIELQAVIDGLKAHAPALVQDIRLFDVYTGKGIATGKKSLAFRIVMQDTERTLQEAEVEAVRQQLIQFLQQNFAAQLRAL